MPRVTVQLPAVLAPMTSGARTFEVEGATVREALADLVRSEPALGMHLFDEGGGVRRYVACFHNEEYLSASEALSRALAEGDRITILNSIAGGAGGAGG